MSGAKWEDPWWGRLAFVARIFVRDGRVVSVIPERYPVGKNQRRRVKDVSIFLTARLTSSTPSALLGLTLQDARRVHSE